MDAVKILMVDDEERMRKLVKDFLTIKGYRVLEAGDGEQAIDIFFKEKDISLVILDVMMPKMDGWETCKTIRRYSQVPIIMLTARSEERDELLGFELGVDEYITKPFSLMVLRARIEKVLKKQTSSTEYQDENYHFYFERMEFFFNDTPVELSKTEQKLLKILVFNRNQVMTREILIDRIWSNGAEFVDENALSVTVNRLRKKLDAGNRIQTVYGIGYTWRNE